MPPGPFPYRAPAPYGDLNLVSGQCGFDGVFSEQKNPTEAPLPLSDAILSGDLGAGSGCPQKVDLLIVGAGLSGCVLAERCANELGLTSLIVEKRDHIGGNCYDYVTEKGIRASKYGAHLFHTKFERVWEYVQNFSEWIPFDHRVRGLVAGRDGAKKLVPIPPVHKTVNKLFGEGINSEQDMLEYYERVRVKPSGKERKERDDDRAVYCIFTGEKFNFIDVGGRGQDNPRWPGQRRKYCTVD